MRLSALCVSLLVVGSAALLNPVTAVADERGGHRPRPDGDPDLAIVYEVAEWGSFVPPFAPPDERRRRKATATLVGTVEAGSTFCPKKLNAPFCYLTILASNDISLTSGRGPVEGDFWVVMQLDNPVDGAEGVILKGTLFNGRVDLSPTLQSPIPIPVGFLSGQWEVKGVREGPLEGYDAGGTVQGTFQLPFVFPPLFPDPSYVISPTAFPGPGCCEAVLPTEFSLGIPTVRLELFLRRGRQD
jgi:hypothetical protein